MPGQGYEMPPASEAPIPLVANRNAKGARSAKLMEWIAAHPGRFSLCGEGTPAEVQEEVRALAAAGAPIIAAAGGDGTLNLVATALAGTDSALGIIPAGTMNVFARELKLPLNNFEKAYQVLQAGKICEVDIFTANGIPFLQMCGVGFDAQVVEATNWEMKKKWGPLAYLVAAGTVFWKKPPYLLLRTPSGTIHEGVFAVMGNGSLYGGPFRLFPEAVHNDGLLDIMLFKKLKSQLPIQALRALFKSRKTPHSKYVEYLRVPGCEIEASGTLPFELDGDVKGTTPVSVKLASYKLKVVTI